MRYVGCLLLLLIAALWGLAHVEVDSPAAAAVPLDSPWRRTRDGWERSDAWGNGRLSPDQAGDPAIGFDASRPHPLLVALLEAMASILVLAAFSPARVADHGRTLPGDSIPPGSR